MAVSVSLGSICATRNPSIRFEPANLSTVTGTTAGDLKDKSSRPLSSRRVVTLRGREPSHARFFLNRTSASPATNSGRRRLVGKDCAELDEIRRAAPERAGHKKAPESSSSKTPSQGSQSRGRWLFKKIWLLGLLTCWPLMRNCSGAISRGAFMLQYRKRSSRFAAGRNILQPGLDSTIRLIHVLTAVATQYRTRGAA